MKAWLLLMALAGLRCLEVAALRPEDVSVTEDGPLLFLRETKGGGTGVVPAHPAIMHALLALPIRNRLWWDCSARHVSILVGAHLRECGISATAHALRHSAGTEFYRASGYDLLTTAKLLRHASVQSSQIYSQVEAARPSQVIRAMRAPVGDAHAATRADTHGSLDLHRQASLTPRSRRPAPPR